MLKYIKQLFIKRKQETIIVNDIVKDIFELAITHHRCLDALNELKMTDAFGTKTISLNGLSYGDIVSLVETFKEKECYLVSKYKEIKLIFA